MTNNYSVKVIKNGQLIQQRQIHSGLAQNIGATRLKAQADAVYVLGTDNAKKPVIKIVSQRVGDDLQLILDGNPKSKPQLIIENYFAPELNAAVATMGSAGELVMFTAENPQQAQSLLTPNQWVAQKAEGATAPWWGSTAVQLGLIGGGLFAVSEIRKKKSSGTSSTTPSTQDAILTYASGSSLQAPPTDTTYKDAGYTGVVFNHVNAINSAILRTQAKDKATAQNIINIYLKIINKANSNAPDTTTDDPTFADYQALKINLTPFSNLGASENSNKVLLLNDIIKNRNASDVTPLSKLDGLASTVDKLILMASDGSPSATLTTAELNAIGLTDVTDANIAAIRSAITASTNDGSGIKTLSQLRSIQTAYLKVLAQADGIKANTTDTTKIPTLDELQSLGITLGKAGTTTDAQQASALQLLNDVIDGLNNAAVDTVAELTAIATAIDKVMDVAKASSTATATTLGLTVSGLNSLGLTGVTIDNLAQVTEAIRLTQSADGKKLNTWKQLQSAVDLGVIMQYAETPLSTSKRVAPAITQYESAGVVTLDSGHKKAITIANVSAINSAVEALNAEKVDTTDELQEIVNTYTKLLNMADGNKGNTVDSLRLSLDDYKRLGALTNYVLPTGAIDGTINSKAATDASTQKAASLSLLNDVIDAKPNDQVNTIAEINALSILVDKLMDQALANPSTTLSVADFSANQGAFLGIQNVNDNNLSQVIRELQDATSSAPNGSAIDTLAEIQSLVSLAIVKMYAQSDNNTAPTLLMYKDLNFSDVDWNNTLVSAVNTVVNAKTKTEINLIDLQGIANAYESILTEASSGLSNSNPDPTARDYEKITLSQQHVFSVNDTSNDKLDDNALMLMNDIVRRKSPGALSSLNEVEKLATQVDALMKIASGTASSNINFSDLSNMGFNTRGMSDNTSYSSQLNKFWRLVADSDNSGASINTWDQVQALINASSVLP